MKEEEEETFLNPKIYIDKLPNHQAHFYIDQENEEKEEEKEEEEEERKEKEEEEEEEEEGTETHMNPKRRSHTPHKLVQRPSSSWRWEVEGVTLRQCTNKTDLAPQLLVM